MIELLIAFTVFVNGQRVVPLVPSLPLSAVAQDRAEYLCTHAFSHEGFVRSYLKVGYWRSTAEGEVLAKGFTKNSDILQAWLRSSTHLKVIQDPRWGEVGFGRACNVTVLEFD